MLKRTLAALLLITTLTSFSWQAEHDCSQHSQQEVDFSQAMNYQILTPEDADYQPTLDEPISQFTVDARLRNYAGADRVKILSAIEVMKTVINSREFQEQILNFTFKGDRRFHQNEGLSNEQIYQQLMDAREHLMPETPGVVNLDLSLYTPKWWQVTQRNVVGYTNPDSMRIYMNTKFFRKFTADEVAGNMTHEWIHKMGFSHDFNDNPDRPFSVPYAIGYIMRELSERVLAGQKLTSLR